MEQEERRNGTVEEGEWKKKVDKINGEKRMHIEGENNKIK